MVSERFKAVVSHEAHTALMAMEMVAGGTFGPRILVELGLRCPSEVPSKGIGEGAKDGWVGVGPCVVARALDR